MVEGSAHSYDVIIAGAGLTGASLAIHLARHRMRVALIEAKAAAPTTTQPERVLALSYGTVNHLQSLDVWKEIIGLGAAPIRCVRAKEPGNLGEVAMRAEKAGVEALGYVVQNAHILKALHARLEDAADMFCPAAITNLEVGDDHVTVAVEEKGGRRRLSAPLIVGADGTHSQVRRMHGIYSVGWDHNRFGIVASVTPERSHRDTAFECFRPSGPLAFLPLDEKRCSIVWTLAPAEAARILSMNDDAFLVELNAAGGDWLHRHLGRMTATGPRASFAFGLHQAAVATADRTALIGNALHTLHPVAGQGLNLGMRDVAVLADVLARAYAAGRDPGAPIVLAEYRERRLADNAAVVAFTEGVNAVFSNRSVPLRLARGLGLAAIQQLPRLRDFLMFRASGLAQQGTGHAG